MIAAYAKLLSFLINPVCGNYMSAGTPIVMENETSLLQNQSIEVHRTTNTFGITLAVIFYRFPAGSLSSGFQKFGQLLIIQCYCRGDTFKHCSYQISLHSSYSVQKNSICLSVCLIELCLDKENEAMIILTLFQIVMENMF